MRVIIVGAMKVEIEKLKSQMVELREHELVSGTAYKGRIGKIHVVVMESGIGKVNAAMTMTELLTAFRHTDYVINTGIAGGHPILKKMDIVIGHGYIQHDVDVTSFGYDAHTIPGMPRIVNAGYDIYKLAHESASLAAEDRVAPAIIASGDQFMETLEQSDKVFHETASLAVDMESAAFAHVCYRFGKQFVAIRTISDIAGEGAEIYEEFEQIAAERSADIVLDVINQLEVSLNEAQS